ncbi:MAG TPA: hypothetical protein VHW23_30335 [Kofleriaceae bacterium]|nr:hypothetical protein [Kofleriaceae bacterium]
MKRALCTLALVLAGCSVSHRSGDFACDTGQRCADGRTCVDGFCVVVADSGLPDTALPPGDAAVCPSQCTSCDLAQKTCTIDCALNNGACSRAISCPASWSCNVECSVANQCNSGVSCGNATSCTIACSGRQTCRNVTCGRGACDLTCGGPGACGNDLACGTGACNVNCTGNAACGGTISCGAACSCDVTCRLAASCDATNITCKAGCNGPATGTPLTFCTTLGTGCNTCP